MCWILRRIFSLTCAWRRNDRAEGASIRRYAGVLAVVVLALLSITTADAQWLNQPTPNIPRTADGKPNLAAPTPRTSDGKPDLSGLWTRRSRTNSAYKPVDQALVDAVVRKRNENFGKEGMAASCLPLGPGYLYAASPDLNFGMTKMIQTPGLIVVLNPDLTYRQIFMDGRGLEADPNPSWMGYSVGHWDGDTLVVESVGFNNRTWLVGYYPHTEGLRAIERYRRSDFGHLSIEVELRDPKMYAAPWTARIEAELAADTELLEYVCNENQTFHAHWVGTRADDQQSEVALSPEKLARYTGTYTERRPHWQDAPAARVFEIKLADGALFLGATRLMPQSETVFINSGLAIEFVLDGRGVPTHLFDKHVSGDYRFDRAK
jgi:hypothetical protein